MNKQDFINGLREAYEYGSCYYEGTIEGHPVKIRMNKDHGRNHRRNDDDDVSNLSLISVFGNGASEVDSIFTNENWSDETVYVQMQKWGISDWEDALEALEEFIDEIQYNN